MLSKFVEIQPFKVGALFPVLKLFYDFATNASQQGLACFLFQDYHWKECVTKKQLTLVAQESHKDSANGACRKLGSYWERLSSSAFLGPCCLASIHWFLAARLAPDRSR